MITYETQPWPSGKYKRYRARNVCSRNAFLLSIEHDHLALVRGYALTGSWWVGHWWCVDESGRVVDPTWRNEGTAYVGEPVDPKEVAPCIRSHGWPGEEFAPHDLVPILDALARHAR